MKYISLLPARLLRYGVESSQLATIIVGLPARVRLHRAHPNIITIYEIDRSLAPGELRRNPGAPGYTTI